MILFPWKYGGNSIIALSFVLHGSAFELAMQGLSQNHQSEICAEVHTVNSHGFVKEQFSSCILYFYFPETLVVYFKCISWKIILTVLFSNLSHLIIFQLKFLLCFFH
jgi:hypothetical protein